MSEFSDRGYFVKENVPIYYTQDMDKALQWFTDILGWNGRIFDRNENGAGVYGFVTDMPKDLVVAQAIPFRGFHLWYGEPLNKTYTLVQVQGIKSLHDYVKRNGWSNISDIENPPWCAGTCDVTTPDGSILTFFE